MQDYVKIETFIVLFSFSDSVSGFECYEPPSVVMWWTPTGVSGILTLN